MQKTDYQDLAPTLPHLPGVYRFLDPEGEILYIGKAKDLKKRISSYFNENNDKRKKTRIMVRSAVHIEYTIVETEQDALLLEASLIRKHKPRYNVALKDSRPYPYLCIKNERFPRVMIVYGAEKDGSKYFGPYTSKSRIYNLLDLIKSLFQLRTCNLNLEAQAIAQNKFKVCLEYHIKNCKAPCVGFESEAEYNQKIEQISNILKGNFASVKRYLKEKMQEHVDNMAFERAQELKIQLTAFENYQGKSTVVNPNIADVDVFSIQVPEEEDLAYVNYLKIASGAIINTFVLELQKNLNDDPQDLLLYAIEELREKFQSIAPEIILPFELKLPWAEVKTTIPQIGDKKKLLDLAEKNLQYYILQKKKQDLQKTNKKTPTERILEQMKKDLQLEGLPLHIECFDNSNLQGTNPVSAMVVFRNAKPAKRDYRHYHIKTVEGPNDFASMEEVVERRYRRLLDEKQPLPQLIIIDGGKGQLSAAMNALERLGLSEKIAMIGIAKRLEEIYFPGDSTPLLLSKKSPTLKVIQQARDEAHRFGLSFHRNLRSKDLVQTQLTEIKGVGKGSAEKLLSHFGSVKKISQADLEAISAVVGKRIAQLVFEHFGQAAQNPDAPTTDDLQS